MKYKTIISLFDIHFPFNIDLSAIYKFIKDIQPDEIILGGDQVDLFGISKYYDGDSEQGMFEAVKEIRGFTKILEEITRLSPKTKIVWLDGNHEFRIRDFINKIPERDELLNIRKLYKKYVDVFVDYNKFYKVGKLYYTHGIYHNDNHSKKTVMATQKNTIYGHLHCFDDKTELLTNGGFKFFKDLDIKNDLAVTYNTTSDKLEYNKINDIVTYNNYKTLLSLEIRNISLLVTPDHGIIDFRRKGKPELKKMSDMQQYKYGRFKCVGQLDRDGIELSDDWIRLLIRIVADGYIDGGKRITFHFNKTRKIKIVNGILDRLGIEYSNNIQKNGNTKIHINLKDTPIAIYLEHGNKKLPDILRNVNKNQADIILEEYTNSDGCVTKKGCSSIQLSSSNYDDCNILHEILVTNGYRCNLTKRKTQNNPNWNQAYILSINPDNQFNEFKTDTIKEVAYESDVSCVSVDNGTLLIRRNGKTCITQNTYQAFAHSSIVGEDAHVAKSVPCLSTLNPDYMKNKPNAWINGFHIAYVYPNGNFNDYIITINDGKFIYGGKIYE